MQVKFPVKDYKSIDIPGVSAKLGVCYVKVTDITEKLDEFMEINPRVPSRTKKGVLSGPIIKGILTTLRDSPQDMVLKNQGIYILTDTVITEFTEVIIELTDKTKHGIINGGHTYAAIREAINTAQTTDEIKNLESAYVRLHLFQGVDADLVPELAEGLNRSKQVDDPSLVNLQGEFDIIRRALRGTVGEKSISYHQGDDGEVYISELLVYLSLFNTSRFNDKKHPNSLYNRQALGLKYFMEDMKADSTELEARISMLPDILWLSDAIRRAAPSAAKNNNFQFGRAKIKPDERAGGAKQVGSYLHFIGEFMPYRVPNGWVYPMLAAFRANLKTTSRSYEWRVPLKKILPEVIDELVGICVVEHRDNNMRPELIGKRESAYSQCFTKLQLYLAKKNLLA